MFFENRQGRLIRILIVDDDPLRGNGLASLLQEMGFAVIGPISTGTEAVALVALERPDLALVNTRLSRSEDGLAIARMLEQVHRLPCVFMISAENHVQAAGWISLYPRQIVDLPPRPTQVLLAIEHALNRQRQLEHAA